MLDSDPSTLSELEALIKKGKSQGYLTYDDVTSYLPDEVVGAENWMV